MVVVKVELRIIHIDQFSNDSFIIQKGFLWNVWATYTNEDDSWHTPPRDKIETWNPLLYFHYHHWEQNMLFEKQSICSVSW